MADKDTQGQDDTLWWELDALPDPSTFGPGFDEPVVWPESLVWDEASSTGAGLGEPLLLPDAPPIDFDADLFPPETEAHALTPPAPPPTPPAPADDLGVNRTGEDTEVAGYLADPLAALGGGAGAQAPARPVVTGDRLPESIWTDPPKTGKADGMLVSTTPTAAAPAFYAETDGPGHGRTRRRLGIRSGNAGVIALISLVSIVLLGMFLSVRARNDVPTDSSQTRLPPGDGIAVTGSLNTVPLTTLATTPPPPTGIDIGALVPPTETTEPPTGSTPVATAAPRASAPAAGPATTTATTAPATQTTTATTAPPPPTTEATPPPTTAAPPVEDTQPPRRTTTSFAIPSIPTTTIPSSTTPSFPFPYTFPTF